MEAHPKTIQIFLPNGEPRGIRLAEITTRVVRAILVPRSKLAEAAKRRELSAVGIYFLFGVSDEQAKPGVYVGEAEDCYYRLGQHNRSKDFWNVAIACVSRTDAFTKAHVKYLEWYCLAKAQDVGRFRIENNAIPTEPYVTEPMQADLMDSFDTLSILVSTLGYPVFDSVRKRTPEGEGDAGGTSDDDLFFCERKNIKAQGRLVEDGFVVYRGSLAAPTEAKSAGSYVTEGRQKLLGNGILAKAGDELRFESDYLFGTPSSAAQAVLGRNANGWTEWKRADGKTLDEVKRRSVDEGAGGSARSRRDRRRDPEPDGS